MGKLYKVKILHLEEKLSIYCSVLMVLFIDEVGDIMSQKNDGNVGGQKVLVQNDQRALI